MVPLALREPPQSPRPPRGPPSPLSLRARTYNVNPPFSGRAGETASVGSTVEPLTHPEVPRVIKRSCPRPRVCVQGPSAATRRRCWNCAGPASVESAPDGSAVHLVLDALPRAGDRARGHRDLSPAAHPANPSLPPSECPDRRGSSAHTLSSAVRRWTVHEWAPRCSARVGVFEKVYRNTVSSAPASSGPDDGGLWSSRVHRVGLSGHR